jgi:arsenate reductase
MYKIFGIPNCDTVKKARTYLDKKKVPSEFIDFKKVKPSDDDIARWSESFGGLPVNTKGATYKKFKEEFEKLGPKAQIKFIQENTSMIKRPILEKNGKVLAFGFDEDQYQRIIQ